MKLSEKTLTVLKSFATINKSIVLKPGKTIRTITPEKTLMAIAKIEDEIPAQACIYDLSRFLSIHGLYSNPDIEFHDRYFTLSEGKKKTKYTFADLSMVHSPPDKEISIPRNDVEVNIEWEDLQSVIKAAGMLQFSEVAFVGEEGKCYLRAIDSSNPSADTFGIEVGETKDIFTIIVKTEKLKLLPRNYNVILCSDGISKFGAEDVSYFIGIDSKSTYKKG
jgi:hypothetical protein